MKINHNIAALNAYRNLSVNNSNTAKSLEKLSSGLRINRASDDAAGLAISEKMRSQIRGLDMAQRNALDGVSFIQTAEGALSSTHSILQRMRELAVQAANDSNTATDRAAIQDEINQMTNEINRISNTTEFNAKKLLNGSLELGGVTTITPGVAAVPGPVTAGVYQVQTGPQDMIIDGNTLAYDETGSKGWNNTTTLVTAINNDAKLSAKYIASDAGGGKIQLTQKPGKESATAPVIGNSVILQIGANEGQTVSLEIVNMRSAALGISSIVLSGQQTITGANGESLNVWYTTTKQSNNGTTDTLTEYTMDVSSNEKASAAISVIDDAIQRVSAERSRMGAVQNRLEYAVDNLKYMGENVTASESRIRDVDMALEMTTYTKNNILVQSAQAMLAQANQLPQGVLQLLK